MDRYSISSKLANTLGIAVGAVIGIPVEEWFSSRKIPPGFTLFCAVVLIALSAWVVTFLADHMFATSSFIRRRMLGYQFVEGTWVDVVFQDGVPLGIGETCIDANGYSVTMFGENYSLEGAHLSGFLSTMVAMQWPVLKLVGENRSRVGGEDSPRSYCELQFSSAGGAPIRYSGYFIMMRSGTRFEVIGWKVNHREELFALRKPHKHRETLLRLARPIIEDRCAVATPAI